MVLKFRSSPWHQWYALSMQFWKVSIIWHMVKLLACFTVKDLYHLNHFFQYLLTKNLSKLILTKYFLSATTSSILIHFPCLRPQKCLTSLSLKYYSLERLFIYQKWLAYLLAPSSVKLNRFHYQLNFTMMKAFRCEKDGSTHTHTKNSFEQMMSSGTDRKSRSMRTWQV